MKLIILSALLLLTTTISAASWPSAIRSEGSDYREIMHKGNKGYYPATSAVQVSYPYSEFPEPKLKEWKNSHEIMEAFTTARDLRFVDWSYGGEFFPRRSTWLYPDDGCYLRAELVVKNLESRGYNNFYKVFAFGNLKVYTDNHPRGYVSWWYHVVPIIAHNDDYLVFDPAINPAGPLSLADWLSTMRQNGEDLKIAVCGAHAVSPYDNCYKPEEEETSSVIYQQKRFLSSEWKRLIDLDRDPSEELGDNPPWSL